MNKNYKEQYLKVKDIKEDQCDCITEEFMLGLVDYLSSLEGYKAHSITSNDSILSSQAHLDTKKMFLLSIDRSSYSLTVMVRFKCSEERVSVHTHSCMNSPYSKTIMIHCSELKEKYKGLQKNTGNLVKSCYVCIELINPHSGTSEGMTRFIELLASLDFGETTLH